MTLTTTPLPILASANSRAREVGGRGLRGTTMRGILLAIRYSSIRLNFFLGQEFL